jgi:tetratricopeptide (TPR) repeat protein
MPAVAEAIPVAQVISSRFEAAAKFLEQALKAGPQDPEAAYLLALAYKRQGKTAEARNALRRIARPDADVFLQLGLLSLQERQLTQAEQEFARALQMDAACYPACYNLLLTRLSLGQIDAARAAARRAVELAPDEAAGWVVVSLVELSDGRWAAAAYAAQRALALDPGDEAAATVLASAQHRLGGAVFAGPGQGLSRAS